MLSVFRRDPLPHTKTTDRSHRGQDVVTSGARYKIPPTRDLPGHSGTLLLLSLLLHPLHHNVSERQLKLLDQGR